MLPTLYALTGEYLAAAERIYDLDASGDAAIKALDELRAPLEAKAVHVAMVARNLEATAEEIRAAVADMERRSAAMEARAERVRAYLRDCMIRAGISRIESAHLVLSVRDNPPAVVVDDASLIPAQYMRTPEPPPPEPDKRAIAAALRDGADIPGVHLVRTRRIDIR